jgi:hypothetical protein
MIKAMDKIMKNFLAVFLIFSILAPNVLAATEWDSLTQFAGKGSDGNRELVQTIERLLSEIEQEINRLRNAKNVPGGKLNVIAEEALDWLKGYKKLQEIYGKLGWAWCDDGDKYAKMLQRVARVFGEPWASEYASIVNALTKGALAGNAPSLEALQKLGERIPSGASEAVAAKEAQRKAAELARQQEIAREAERAAQRLRQAEQAAAEAGLTRAPGQHPTGQAGIWEAGVNETEKRAAEIADTRVGAKPLAGAADEVANAADDVIRAAEGAQASKVGMLGKLAQAAKGAYEALTKIPGIGPLLKGGTKVVGFILGNALVAGVGTAAGAAEGVENIVKLTGAIGEAILAAGASELNAMKAALAAQANKLQKEVSALEKGIAQADALLQVTERSVDAGTADLAALEARQAERDAMQNELNKKRDEMAATEEAILLLAKIYDFISLLQDSERESAAAGIDQGASTIDKVRNLSSSLTADDHKYVIETQISGVQQSINSLGNNVGFIETVPAETEFSIPISGPSIINTLSGTRTCPSPTLAVFSVTGNRVNINTLPGSIVSVNGRDFQTVGGYVSVPRNLLTGDLRMSIPYLTTIDPLDPNKNPDGFVYTVAAEGRIYNSGISKESLKDFQPRRIRLTAKESFSGILDIKGGTTDLDSRLINLRSGDQKTISFYGISDLLSVSYVRGDQARTSYPKIVTRPTGVQPTGVFSRIRNLFTPTTPQTVSAPVQRTSSFGAPTYTAPVPSQFGSPTSRQPGIPSPSGVFQPSPSVQTISPLSPSGAPVYTR